MTNREKRKILNEIGSLFKSLEIQINDLKNGKNLFYILLNENEHVENILDEIKMDRRDFSGTLYEMELRIRTLKDLLNENELI